MAFIQLNFHYAGLPVMLCGLCRGLCFPNPFSFSFFCLSLQSPLHQAKILQVPTASFKTLYTFSDAYGKCLSSKGNTCTLFAYVFVTKIYRHNQTLIIMILTYYYLISSACIIRNRYDMIQRKHIMLHSYFDNTLALWQCNGCTVNFSECYAHISHI